MPRMVKKMSSVPNFNLFNLFQIPQNYFCFCKKEINPVNHLWTVPHSCGEVCAKPLKSLQGFCSHRCTVLCHPGPCPPCSQTISVSCECNKSNLRTIRCVHQYWKCGNNVSIILLIKKDIGMIQCIKKIIFGQPKMS